MLSYFHPEILVSLLFSKIFWILISWPNFFKRIFCWSVFKYWTETLVFSSRCEIHFRTFNEKFVLNFLAISHQNKSKMVSERMINEITGEWMRKSIYRSKSQVCSNGRIFLKRQTSSTFQSNKFNCSIEYVKYERCAVAFLNKNMSLGVNLFFSLCTYMNDGYISVPFVHATLVKIDISMDSNSCMWKTNRRKTVKFYECHNLRTFFL